jgi:hypothetical protein
MIALDSHLFPVWYHFRIPGTQASICRYESRDRLSGSLFNFIAVCGTDPGDARPYRVVPEMPR